MSSDKPVYIEQERRGAVDPSSTLGIVYQVISKVVVNSSYTGDSEDKTHLLNLFVNNIVSSSDPNQDTFDHYATLADLDLLHNSREKATASGASQYRDNVNTLNFDNLSVAVTAAEVVRDTINNVVDTYLKVKTTFMGTSQHYFPYNIEVQALKNQYSTSYTAARDARVASETAQNEAQAIYETKQLASKLKKDSRDTIKPLKDALTSMNSLVHIISARYKDTLAAIITDYEATDSSPTIAELKTFLADATEANLTYDSNFTTRVLASTDNTGLTLLAQIIKAFSDANTSFAVSEQAVLTSTLEEENAFSDLKSKQQLKDNAASAETEALATLTTYCPNLDPASL